MAKKYLWRCSLVAALVIGLAGSLRLAAAPPPAPSIQFVDATAAAKIAFKHTSGAFGKKYLPGDDGRGRGLPRLRRRRLARPAFS